MEGLAGTGDMTIRKVALSLPKGDYRYDAVGNIVTWLQQALRPRRSAHRRNGHLHGADPDAPRP